ncbi:hypothetical protein VNO77_19894 [Canavalia gladiata]|uniref:Uncharacterized protein n=1 Tax=Canavalia gladiata TaxID=3824 RepID=A0AAN9LS54_CANGL
MLGKSHSYIVASYLSPSRATNHEPKFAWRLYGLLSRYKAITRTSSSRLNDLRLKPDLKPTSKLATRSQLRHVVVADFTSLAVYECDLEFFPARPLRTLKGSTTSSFNTDHEIPLANGRVTYQCHKLDQLKHRNSSRILTHKAFDEIPTSTCDISRSLKETNTFSQVLKGPYIRPGKLHSRHIAVEFPLAEA